MPRQTAEKWVLLYRIGGEAALTGERGDNKAYDYETKLAAVRDRVEHGLTKAEVMARYGIASIAPLERWCREYRAGGPDALRPKPKGRPRGARSKPKPTPTREQLLEEENAYLRARIAYLEKVDALLAGLGHPLRCLLRASGLARSTYYYLLSHPARVTRPDIEPMVAEVFHRAPNGCGHRQVRMCLVREFGVRVGHRSMLKVMRRMGLECRIRCANPYRRYSSYRGDASARVENLLNRDFSADRPWVKLGTDVTEFRVASGRAYLAPVYDMGSKEIVAWDVSRHPDLAQQQRLLAMLEEKLPEGANPILHSDMGWQYRHDWWRDRLAELGIRQSMSRKGDYLDNAATEQVFGHLKDEFYTGREFDSYEQFERELAAYIVHWNTRRHQKRLEGRTPEEFRNMSLTA